MVSDLSATIDSEDFDSRCIQNVLIAGVEAQRKDRVVLDEPDLIGGIAAARRRKSPHFLPYSAQRTAT